MMQHEIANCPWDAVVVGAGPAGAVAARQLALASARVLLVDKAPLGRWKVCGCCLNAAAGHTLCSIGMGDLLRQHRAVPLRQIRVATQRCEVTLPMSGGVSISREAFDAALVQEAIAAGAAFLPEAHATLGPADGEIRIVDIALGLDRFRLEAKLILAADGLAGNFMLHQGRGRPAVQPHSRIGAGTVLPQRPKFVEHGTISMACSRAGYVGLVVLQDGRTNVAAALDPARVRSAGGLGPLAAMIVADVGWPDVESLVNANWRGTPALTRRPTQLADERVLVLGDAAGYVEPFTGEGMAWAITSAVAITPLALQAISHWTPTIGDDWARVYRQTVASRQNICRNVAWGLRHPIVVRAAIRLLSLQPWLADPVIRRLNAC